MKKIRMEEIKGNISKSYRIRLNILESYNIIFNKNDKLSFNDKRDIFIQLNSKGFNYNNLFPESWNFKDLKDLMELNKYYLSNEMELIEESIIEGLEIYIKSLKGEFEKNFIELKDNYIFSYIDIMIELDNLDFEDYKIIGDKELYYETMEDLEIRLNRYYRNLIFNEGLYK